MTAPSFSSKFDLDSPEPPLTLKSCNAGERFAQEHLINIGSVNCGVQVNSSYWTGNEHGVVTRTKQVTKDGCLAEKQGRAEPNEPKFRKDML